MSNILNPSNEMAQFFQANLDKFIILGIHKMGGSVTFTEDDIKAIDGLNLTVASDDNGIHFKLVSEAEAKRLAMLNGGLKN